MLSEKDFKYSIKYTFKTLKEECLLIIKEYRKIIFSLDKPEIKTDTILDMFVGDQYNIDSICKIVDGQVDEEGNIFITDFIKEKFKNKIKEKCLSEINYYILYVTKYIDIFIDALINFKNPITVLIHHSNCNQLKFLFECWLGDIYSNEKIKYFDAILKFADDVSKKRMNINENTFNHLFYSEEINQISNDPIEDISTIL